MVTIVAIQCASKEIRIISLFAFAPFSSFEEVILECMGRIFGVKLTLSNPRMIFAAESRDGFMFISSHRSYLPKILSVQRPLFMVQMSFISS